jgi:DNA-binding transcriptional regulator LsrR (DeoR family)
VSTRYKYRTRLGMSPEIAEEIRRKYWAREATQAELGRQYGMAQQSVSRIICGYYWNYEGINF